jgi:hypothetical protein
MSSAKSKKAGFVLIALLGYGISLFVARAMASSGLWFLYVHMCGSGPNATKCVDGINKDKAFVSKTECESAAQDFVDEMERLEMKILSIRCVQE